MSNVYCGGQTSDHVIHMRRLGLSFAPQYGTKKEQQSLSKAHYFYRYFKINIISKSTTAFVLTRIRYGGGSVNLPNRTQNSPKMSYSLLA